jgi:hypothetical protein
MTGILSHPRLITKGHCSTALHQLGPRCWGLQTFQAFFFSPLLHAAENSNL